jgi:hypothetical protein
MMSISGKDIGISFPEVTERVTMAISSRNGLPQFTTSLLAAVTDSERNDLACTAAHDCPNPAFLALGSHKGPYFIEFKDVFILSSEECITQRWESSYMFFQPIQCRLPTDPKHTLYPSQAHPLSVGFQDTFFENLRVASLGFQDPIRSTFFTVILLVATLVCAVLDYIPATTGTTLVDDDLTQHVPYFLLSSLTFQPLPEKSHQAKPFRFERRKEGDRAGDQAGGTESAT